MEIVKNKKAIDGLENQMVAILVKMINRFTNPERTIDEALERSSRVAIPDGHRETAVISAEISNSEQAILQPWGDLQGVDTVEAPKLKPEKNAIIILGAQ